jgi:hypothetical protein
VWSAFLSRERPSVLLLGGNVLWSVTGIISQPPYVSRLESSSSWRISCPRREGYKVCPHVVLVDHDVAELMDPYSPTFDKMAGPHMRIKSHYGSGSLFLFRNEDGENRVALRALALSFPLCRVGLRCCLRQHCTWCLSHWLSTRDFCGINYTLLHFCARTGEIIKYKRRDNRR